MILKLLMFLNIIQFPIPEISRLMKIQADRPHEKIIYQTHFDKEIMDNFNKHINHTMSQDMIKNYIQSLRMTDDGGCDIDFLIHS